MNIEKTIEALKKKRYQVKRFQSKEEAVIYLKNEIKNKSVGFGDSNTLLCMKLFEALSENNTVHDPQQALDNESFLKTASECLAAEIYITSANALAQTGEIVNIDGTGNRVAGSLFGHEKVYFVIGENKLEKTLEEAIHRARNIAAPKNAKRLKLKTPCAIKGDRCYDCASAQRICSALVIHYAKMHDTEMEVVIINENLGF